MPPLPSAASELDARALLEAMSEAVYVVDASTTAAATGFPWRYAPGP